MSHTIFVLRLYKTVAKKSTFILALRDSAFAKIFQPLSQINCMPCISSSSQHKLRFVLFHQVAVAVHLLFSSPPISPKVGKL